MVTDPGFAGDIAVDPEEVRTEIDPAEKVQREVDPEKVRRVGAPGKIRREVVPVKNRREVVLGRVHTPGAAQEMVCKEGFGIGHWEAGTLY